MIIKLFLLYCNWYDYNFIGFQFEISNQKRISDQLKLA